MVRTTFPLTFAKQLSRCRSCLTVQGRMRWQRHPERANIRNGYRERDWDDLFGQHRLTIAFASRIEAIFPSGFSSRVDAPNKPFGRSSPSGTCEASAHLSDRLGSSGRWGSTVSANRRSRGRRSKLMTRPSSSFSRSPDPLDPRPYRKVWVDATRCTKAARAGASSKSPRRSLPASTAKGLTRSVIGPRRVHQ